MKNEEIPKYALVKVRSWEEMAKECGTGEDDEGVYIKGPVAFNIKMERYLPPSRIIKVKNITPDNYLEWRLSHNSEVMFILHTSMIDQVVTDLTEKNTSYTMDIPMKLPRLENYKYTGKFGTPNFNQGERALDIDRKGNVKILDRETSLCYPIVIKAEKQPKQRKRLGEKYWYMDSSLRPQQTTENNSPEDEEHFRVKNYCDSEEEVMEIIEKVLGTGVFDRPSNMIGDNE